MSLPDFFLVGAPKGSTTALHAALAQHPAPYLSPVKEPKFYLCDGRRPRRFTSTTGLRTPGSRPIGPRETYCRPSRSG